jgi:FtsP/CotA-like multicopper oxidase with cupredoxin domain
MHKTAEHVYMGLAGMIIIDDAEMDALNLPKEYGVDDIPLVLQGKRFDSAGQIDYSPSNMEIKMGYKSDVMLANGVINPYLDVPAKKVRLRVLNGSNARVYNLKFKNGKTFQQIGVDNSLLEKPVTLSSVTLSPGERAEIVVDFSADLGSEFLLVDGNSNLEIMKVNVNSSTTKTSTVPETLTTLTKLDDTAAVRTRKFVLNMAKGADGAMHMAINGKLMDMARIDEVVPKDDIEVWEITNMMGMSHNFHIHATHFLPLTRNGVAVDENERGYKDVITMPGKSTVKVVVKMTDFVDDNTGYMYHCHFLEHEDDGMMGQFSVTDGSAVVNVRP